MVFIYLWYGNNLNDNLKDNLNESFIDPANYFSSGFCAPQYCPSYSYRPDQKAKDIIQSMPGYENYGKSDNSNKLHTTNNNIKTPVCFGDNDQEGRKIFGSSGPNESGGDRLGDNSTCRKCSDLDVPIENGQHTNEDTLAYSQGVIERQAEQLKYLRKRVKRLAFQIDDANMFYRKKLSNKYYRPKPFLADPGVNNLLNLNDDDFSTKTLSTIKFLSQTRPSKYYGTEIHFPTELCGNFCTTSDTNAQLHEQVDTVRPIQPPGMINIAK
tara:strand:- start:6845 stop:7651 length:807 start_codon:yes stop_codon:yes gene_type:complete